jgi:hypothetical protein
MDRINVHYRDAILGIVRKIRFPLVPINATTVEKLGSARPAASVSSPAAPSASPVASMAPANKP